MEQLNKQAKWALRAYLASVQEVKAKLYELKLWKLAKEANKTTYIS